MGRHLGHIPSPPPTPHPPTLTPYLMSILSGLRSHPLVSTLFLPSGNGHSNNNRFARRPSMDANGNPTNLFKAVDLKVNEGGYSQREEFCNDLLDVVKEWIGNIRGKRWIEVREIKKELEDWVRMEVDKIPLDSSECSKSFLSMNPLSTISNHTSISTIDTKEIEDSPSTPCTPPFHPDMNKPILPNIIALPPPIKTPELKRKRVDSPNPDSPSSYNSSTSIDANLDNIPCKKPKAKKPTPTPRRCSYCSISSTPMWRHGPPSHPHLCNSCGVKWKRGKILRESPPGKHFTGCGVNSPPQHKKLDSNLSVITTNLSSAKISSSSTTSSFCYTDDKSLNTITEPFTLTKSISKKSFSDNHMNDFHLGLPTPDATRPSTPAGPESLSPAKLNVSDTTITTTIEIPTTMNTSNSCASSSSELSATKDRIREFANMLASMKQENVKLLYDVLTTAVGIQTGGISTRSGRSCYLNSTMKTATTGTGNISSQKNSYTSVNEMTLTSSMTSSLSSSCSSSSSTSSCNSLTTVSSRLIPQSECARTAMTASRSSLSSSSFSSSSSSSWGCRMEQQDEMNVFEIDLGGVSEGVWRRVREVCFS